jgi:hypothetical protein
MILLVLKLIDSLACINYSCTLVIFGRKQVVLHGEESSPCKKHLDGCSSHAQQNWFAAIGGGGRQLINNECALLLDKNDMSATTQPIISRSLKLVFLLPIVT